ncbi:MAG: CRISPR-associated helicase Cas3' [Clostridiales Family XIII bacterium]|jgi:CRISPR-associated endonuclease/helicase Cas3|nr:CRISPR-associated helicase Cas3' [Clostridiales Family XIII bacterium]
MEHIAHRRENAQGEWEEQSLLDHLEGTGKLCREFASAFGGGDLGELLGQAHDIGKYSVNFNRRILGGKERVDHSTAGGQVVDERMGCTLFSYAIFGHHGGLQNGGSKYDDPDAGTWHARLKKKLNGDDDFSAYESELKLTHLAAEPELYSNVPGFSISFLVRMLFSCLVDADFLDTEAFMSANAVKRGGYDDVGILLARLERYKEGRFKTSDEISEIDKKRNEIFQNCREKALGESGLYSLTVPTGGGKTLASLIFALRHAKERGKRRVIYVIPYTNIIEQTGKVFAAALGKGNVVEHHYNINYDNKNPEQSRKYLSTENWDAPVIVTTSVQFFESLFAARTSSCRKLHNIAESVIVFDEAQMLPIPYLKPCVSSIVELVLNYRCTALLCTATQPTLDKFIPRELLERIEICEEPEALNAFFKRVSIEVIENPLDDETLASRLKEHERVLCIVNTRKQAQKLYSMIEGENCFHLSTLMPPVLRRWVLRKVRLLLKHEKPCRLIATSLVEAGVDVDFPVVYRAAAGLDSIIQAAGRCNREGHGSRDASKVYVFTPDSSYSIPASQRRPIDVFRSIAKEHEGDITSLSAIRAYFEVLYHIEGDDDHSNGLDKKKILQRFNDGVSGHSFPFKDIAEEFQLIEEKTYIVLIPFGYGRRIEAALRCGERSRTLMRVLGRYSVNVRERHCNALLQSGSIEHLDEKADEGIYVLLDENKFDVNTGVALDIQSGQALFFDS